MTLYTDLITKKEKMTVIGLGYVGLVLAVAFAKKLDVIGFDINQAKVNHYLNGVDVTDEVGSEVLKQTTLNFTCDPSRLQEAKFHIIAVPTPINPDHTPDLSPVISASKTVGSYLVAGSIVVYESTVYPGVTEEICIPILEQTSGLKCGVDFKVGYSPERVNPGDKVHTVDKIIKIVSGMDANTLEIISKVYELVIDAGVYKAPSIKVAEAAKVIENSQRDINIAFMNELSIIFDKMDLDTLEVLKAASTKWNFLSFFPGLVGGHCIGVDPYYLTYKSDLLGYHSRVILSGRAINDGMGKHIAEKTIKLLIQADKRVKGARIGILGITFKENCPDIRNSKVMDIINELQTYGVNLFVTDPLADSEEVAHEYGLQLTSIEQLKDMDTIILAVGHDDYKHLKLQQLTQMFVEPTHYPPVFIDVKGLFDKNALQSLGYLYWRL